MGFAAFDAAIGKHGLPTGGCAEFVAVSRFLEPQYIGFTGVKCIAPIKEETGWVKLRLKVEESFVVRNLDFQKFKKRCILQS